MQTKNPQRCFAKPTSISSYLRCPICLEVFVYPLRLFCGHTLCLNCLRDCIKKSDVCPMCRVTIDFEEIGRNSIAEHIINELEVLCPNDDCPWRGECVQLATHYSKCTLKSKQQYKKNNSKGNPFIPQLDEDIIEKINENTSKGNLLARVLHRGKSADQFDWIETSRDLINSKQNTNKSNTVTIKPNKKQSEQSATDRYNQTQQVPTESKKSSNNNEDIDFLFELLEKDNDS